MLLKQNKYLLMKKCFSILFLITISSNFTFSQTSSEKAKKMLDKVVKNLKKSTNVVIDFKYTLNNPKEKVNQESKGTVAMQANKYVLNFMGLTKIFDGKKVYSILPEDEEITISNSEDEDANAITPNKIFSFFNSGFIYAIDITQKVGKNKIQYIKLTPTNAKDQRKEILMGINSRTNQIYTLIEIGKNGTKTTLTVLDYKVNQKLAKGYFTFDKAKFPNYYVNKAD